MWRKKLVLHSMRVDVFMGYMENPIPLPPPPDKNTGFCQPKFARSPEKLARGGGWTQLICFQGPS